MTMNSRRSRIPNAAIVIATIAAVGAIWWNADRIDLAVQDRRDEAFAAEHVTPIVDEFLHNIDTSTTSTSTTTSTTRTAPSRPVATLPGAGDSGPQELWEINELWDRMHATTTTTLPELPEPVDARILGTGTTTVAPAAPTGNPQPRAADSWYVAKLGQMDAFPVWATASDASNYNQVLDYGGGAAWPGTTPGAPENHVVFCHRTSKGGPCRHILGLHEGEAITLTYADGTTQTWTIRTVEIIPQEQTSILDRELTVDGQPTLRFIACGHADGSPGGVSHRIVVTATPA